MSSNHSMPLGISRIREGSCFIIRSGRSFHPTPSLLPFTLNINELKPVSTMYPELLSPNRYAILTAEGAMVATQKPLADNRIILGFLGAGWRQNLVCLSESAMRTAKGNDF